MDCRSFAETAVSPFGVDGRSFVPPEFGDVNAPLASALLEEDEDLAGSDLEGGRFCLFAVAAVVAAAAPADGASGGDLGRPGGGNFEGAGAQSAD